MGYEVHFKGGKLDILDTISMNYVAKGLSTPEDVGNYMASRHRGYCDGVSAEHRKTIKPPCTPEGVEEIRKIWTEAGKKEVLRAGRVIAEIKSIIEEQMKDEDRAVDKYASLSVVLEKLGFDLFAKKAKDIMNQEGEHKYSLRIISEGLWYRSPEKPSSGGKESILGGLK